MIKFFKVLYFVIAVSILFAGCRKDQLGERKAKTVILMGMEDDPNAETPTADAFDKWFKGGMVGDPPTPLSPSTPQWYGNTPNPDAYNCHFYAWGASPGGNSTQFPSWSNTPNTADYHSLNYNAANQVGDRIVYYGINSQGSLYATHSGIVTGVDSNGMATEITSKWGEMGVYEHAPVDVPSTYGPASPTFEYDGTTYESRVYFRAN